MPRRPLSNTDLVAYAGLIASAIAVMSSIASCQISRSALQISKMEYNNARTLVLKGEVIDGTQSIKLSPHDPAFLLQEVYYKFPSALSKDKKYVIGPNYFMELTEEIVHFKKELRRRYADKISDGVLVGDNARMPFLIETYSSTKGQSFRSMALYTLNFGYRVPQNSKEEPSLTLTGITFGGGIKPTEDAQALLEQQWKSALAQ